MIDFYIKQNDTGPQLQVQLTDANGVPVDVTGCDIIFIMKLLNRTTVKIREVAVIIDGPTGIVGYNWQTGDTSDAKLYDGEFQVTFPSGIIITFPNNTNLKIQVFPELGS